MKADWIAVDWGTSNLRIWAMNAQGCTIDQQQSDEGADRLQAHEFENILLKHVEGWLDGKETIVIACGMVGRHQGWMEVPYAKTPCTPTGKLVKIPNTDSRISVHILSGIQQDSPSDVMRGEETQIAGMFAEMPEYKGVICLPGTHSKWVNINNNQIKDFKTVMTGEFFNLLSRYSILRHGLGKWNDEIFIETVKTIVHAPETVLASLFEIRACALLEGPQQGIAQLSGTLIGAELAGTRHYWQGRAVEIIGKEELTRLYRFALEALNIKASTRKGDELSLLGLQKAYEENFS